MNKKITSTFVAAIIGMGVMPTVQAGPNLFERVFASGHDENNNYSAYINAEDFFGDLYAYVTMYDSSNNLILYCYGTPTSNPVNTTGSAKEGKVEFNTGELYCPYGGATEIVSMTCSFDGVNYYNLTGNASSFYMGVTEQVHSNYKKATADCNVKIGGYELNIDGNIWRQQWLDKQR